MEGKVKTLKSLKRITARLHKQGKTVGLITGFFDILHIGHLELFSKSKKLCDYLIVGTDNDETVKLVKGEDRPVNKLKDRLAFLSALEFIDYVFPIEEVFGREDNDLIDEVHKNILQTLRPDFVFTNSKADKYWDNKLRRIKNLRLGTKLVDVRHSLSSSSSKIIKLLLKDL